MFGWIEVSRNRNVSRCAALRDAFCCQLRAGKGELPVLKEKRLALTVEAQRTSCECLENR